MAEENLNPLLTMFVGPPGSGKSTQAHDYLKAHNNRSDLVRISQDDQGKKEHMALFHQSVNARKDIVVDRMNFDTKQRNRYLDVAKKAGYDTRIIVLHVSQYECMKRIRSRKDHPTIKTEDDAFNAVTFFFKNYERVQDSEADEVIRMGWKPYGSTRAIVCDLDGTMANVEHRRKYVRPDNLPEGKKFRPNWKKFFDEMINDGVNLWCSEIVSMMSERYPIIYATGRPGDYVEHTELWLNEQQLRFSGDFLFMRPEGDYRKDSVIKEIILEFEIKTRYDILFILDDRKQVVDMWRSHGYTVLQCDPGEF